ncbi:MAG TPA: hypothetical protein VIG08_13895 [Gemmatimonadales bacterium]
MQDRMAALVSTLIVVALAAGCDDASAPATPTTQNPSFTESSGGEATELGRATFGGGADGFRARRVTGDWSVDLKAKPAFDLAVQQVVLHPGGQSGWRRSPGPSFIIVLSGVVKFYEADDPKCKPIVRRAGQGYFDLGEHAHIARNESNKDAETLLTFIAPPGATLRIDEPAPKNCAF